MSEVINEAVVALNDKMNGGFDGTAKFVVEGEGAIIIDENGARAGDDDADVTLTALPGVQHDVAQAIRVAGLARHVAGPDLFPFAQAV